MSRFEIVRDGDAKARQPVPANDGLSRLMELACQAVEDETLATELLSLPPAWRARTVHQDARFHRESLAKLLLLGAEVGLFSDRHPGVGRAATGALVAQTLTLRPSGPACQRVVLGHWLAGKVYLRRRKWRLAERAFRDSAVATVSDGERGLGFSAYGMGQLRLSQGQAEAAVGHFSKACSLFRAARDHHPAAAAGALLGILLVREGEVLTAQIHLRRALLHLGDPATAPSLAGRMLLTLARCESRLNRRDGMEDYFAQARALASVSIVPGEPIAQKWAEAEALADLGDFDAAEERLDEVRRDLLAEGRITEAERCAFEQVLLSRITGSDDRFSQLLAFLSARQIERLRDLMTAHLPFEPVAHEIFALRGLPFRLTEAEIGAGEIGALATTEALADRLLRYLPEQGGLDAGTEDVTRSPATQGPEAGGRLILLRNDDSTGDDIA
jgi:tetratricopeptide (TPR) repeat protein